ncbi:MAG: hypothetical protein KJ058_14355, partial [Thermoanaerobaculia bacterium]|nr:hypothetical protein [Thermoanaerobaculia bacterium]
MSGATPMELATARRILALVPHARRFPVGHLRPPTGVIPSFVRSLGELEFVLLPQADSLPGVHFERLAAWIENDVGDPAGAAAVREATAAAPSYVAACQAAYERIRDRGGGAPPAPPAPPPPTAPAPGPGVWPPGEAA